jgi:hypothetical protein
MRQNVSEQNVSPQNLSATERIGEQNIGMVRKLEQTPPTDHVGGGSDAKQLIV